MSQPLIHTPPSLPPSLPPSFLLYRRSGFQTIPLLELGYDVTAIDMSEDLLQELEEHRGEGGREGGRKGGRERLSASMLPHIYTRT